MPTVEGTEALLGPGTVGGVSLRRAPIPLVVAAACTAAAAVVWLTAYNLAPFTAIDQRTLDGFVGLLGPDTVLPAERISKLADPRPFALFSVALILLALARRRPGTAIAIAGILLGSNVTTQLLKPALALPPAVPGLDPASWPSGHATAAMALVLCLQLAVPQRWRPMAAAAGGLFALGVASSVLILDHHRPSDIVGGFLVAGAWTALGVAALRATAARGPAPTADGPAPRTAAALVPVAAVAAALIATASVLVIAHWTRALDYAAAHTTFLAGGTVIALGAMGMAAVASLALRQT
jgi:membrane-associated phospholipid phosphatase